jgi:tRNA (cmo5U34)-methyltransferase
MRREVPEYDRLQHEVVAVSAGGLVRAVLELGTGTGETARRLLHAHPEAHLTGIDASPEMLDAARAALPAARVDLCVGRLEEPLPDGVFDLVVSVLAVHHLDGPGKADLFRRVAAVLAGGGRFVLGDVVVPTDPADAITPLTPDYDMPSPVADQLTWLRDAGLIPALTWSARDLAVLTATKGV